MDNNTGIPAIQFGEDCDYDTLHSVLGGWCARIWLSDGVILVALWKGGEGGETDLLVWSENDQDFSVPLTIPTDNVRKIEVL